MLQQLSGVSIVLFIAAGVQTVLLLFIFAKRQIVRFTLRARRGPHIPIALDTKKSLRKEIDRRIQAVPRINYEPHLDDYIQRISNNAHKSSQYYRLKAVNDIKTLEYQIIQHDTCFKRNQRDNLRGFLLSTLPTTLSGNGQRMLHQFCDLYERARHDPSDFKDEEYEVYSKLLLKIVDAYV